MIYLQFHGSWTRLTCLRIGLDLNVSKYILKLNSYYFKCIYFVNEIIVNKFLLYTNWIIFILYCLDNVPTQNTNLIAKLGYFSK